MRKTPKADGGEDTGGRKTIGFFITSQQCFGKPGSTLEKQRLTLINTTQ